MKPINKEELIKIVGHVVVLMGGSSVEREVSLKSGQAVYRGLVRLGIDCELIDAGSNVVEQLQQAKPDLVFNMMHGQIGEDGVMQGVFESMSISYTGSGVLPSALAMDKVKTKLLWQRLGLSTADFTLLSADTDWQSVIDELGSVVVKPVNGGSSLGIFISATAEELASRYSEAAKFDARVFAEKCIVGKEFSVGVMNGELLPAIELETDREFFDFDAKYVDEGTRVYCPPKLDQKQLDGLHDLVLEAYESLSCEGLARVDVMQDREGVFYLLEVNTVPGMTDHSFIPLAAKEAGLDFDDLLLRVLDSHIASQREQ
ncbi:MAG: D-alanine--D-alanine ligase [Pseudohongiellaceae bacterium]